MNKLTIIALSTLLVSACGDDSNGNNQAAKDIKSADAVIADTKQADNNKDSAQAETVTNLNAGLTKEKSLTQEKVLEEKAAIVAKVEEQQSEASQKLAEEKARIAQQAQTKKEALKQAIADKIGN